MELEIIARITQKIHHETPFDELVKGFEKKLSDFNPIKNAFDIQEYFGGKMGQVSATQKLVKDKKIDPQWLYPYVTTKGNKKTDFKGLYVFIHNNVPIYVGISKGVIGRIFQHLKGHSHNTSTLAYNIGLIKYEIEKGAKYTGGRKEFDFNADVKPAKEFLLKQKIAFLSINNTEEMYLFEIYCAMNLQCWLNKFETH